MLSIFTWPAEPEEPRKPASRRASERPRRFEALLARSHAEMRARRRQPA